MQTWLHVLSLALASTMLTQFYLEPLRKNISKFQKAQNLLACVVTYPSSTILQFTHSPPAALLAPH